MAYDVGIHVGDGNMYTYGRINRITYCGHLGNEADFYRFLKRFLKKLYNVTPLYIERPSDNTILLLINSKSILEFKKNKLKLPVGPKDNVKIPQQIMNNRKYMKAFMRGLGDTDFSLSFKKNRKGIHKEPRLEWYTKSKPLSLQVSKILNKFGFTFKIEEKKGKYEGFLLRMYGHKNLNLWMENFGFYNSWTLLKLKVWKKLGYYPIRKSYNEISKLLKG